MAAPSPGVCTFRMGRPRAKPSKITAHITSTIRRLGQSERSDSFRVTDIRPETLGATSEQIAYGDVRGRRPWAYSRPKAAISAGVRMEPKSSGILGMFRRSRFNLRARSKAPRLEISRNSGTLLPITPASRLNTAPAAPAKGLPAIPPTAAPLIPEITTLSNGVAMFLVANPK